MGDDFSGCAFLKAPAWKRLFKSWFGLGERKEVPGCICSSQPNVCKILNSAEFFKEGSGEQERRALKGGGGCTKRNMAVAEQEHAPPPAPEQGEGSGWPCLEKHASLSLA